MGVCSVSVHKRGKCQPGFGRGRRVPHARPPSSWLVSPEPVPESSRGHMGQLHHVAGHVSASHVTWGDTMHASQDSAGPCRLWGELEVPTGLCNPSRAAPPELSHQQPLNPPHPGLARARGRFGAGPEALTWISVSFPEPLPSLCKAASSCCLCSCFCMWTDTRMGGEGPPHHPASLVQRPALGHHVFLGGSASLEVPWLRQWTGKRDAKSPQPPAVRHRWRNPSCSLGQTPSVKAHPGSVDLQGCLGCCFPSLSPNHLLPPAGDPLGSLLPLQLPEVMLDLLLEATQDMEGMAGGEQRGAGGEGLRAERKSRRA